MKVSICVPVYNGSEFLSACLNSILDQSYHDFELLIVDDCSSDASLLIAMAYESEDKRVRVISNKSNLGLVGNWNRCITLARGKWIKFVFQDDLLFPYSISMLVETAQRYPEAALIIGRRDFYFEDQVNLSFRKHYTSHAEFVDRFFGGSFFLVASQFSVKYLHHTDLNNLPYIKFRLSNQSSVESTLSDDEFSTTSNIFGEPTSSMFLKESVEKIGFFNEYMIQLCDAEFWVRLASNYGVAYVPEKLSIFRVHSSSTTANNINTRLYRSTFLDPLVFFHDLLYNPVYDSLRLVSQSLISRQTLVKQFISRKKLALYEARKTQSSGSLLEFNYLGTKYPLLTYSPQRFSARRFRRILDKMMFSN